LSLSILVTVFEHTRGPGSHRWCIDLVTSACSMLLFRKLCVGDAVYEVYGVLVRLAPVVQVISPVRPQGLHFVL
jgi:hypothetical protein